LQKRIFQSFNFKDLMGKGPNDLLIARKNVRIDADREWPVYGLTPFEINVRVSDMQACGDAHLELLTRLVARPGCSTRCRRAARAAPVGSTPAGAVAVILSAPGGFLAYPRPRMSIAQICDPAS
jgi:hypothetical protein